MHVIGDGYAITISVLLHSCLHDCNAWLLKKMDKVRACFKQRATISKKKVTQGCCLLSGKQGTKSWWDVWDNCSCTGRQGKEQVNTYM